MAIRQLPEDGGDPPSSWRYLAAFSAVLVAAAAQRRYQRGSGPDVPEKAAASLVARLPLGLAATLSLATITLATANRVMYKVALVPLRNYVFFLAQFTTFGYVLAYWAALLFNSAQGNITDLQVDFARERWRTFAQIGCLEAGSFLLGMLGAKALPGSILPVLGQLYLVFQMTFSFTLLGRKYSLRELAGCALCVSGVITASAGGLGSESLRVPLHPAMLFVVSLALPALGSVLKERLFKEARSICGEELNVFVVNTLGSSFQAAGVFLLLPVLASLQGVGATPAAIGAYLADGAAAFASQPFWPCLYLCLNLGFNVTLLVLLRTTSAVTVSLSVAAAVPATAVIFASCDIPLLGQGQPLDRWFAAGLCLILLGLGLYHGWAQKLYPSSLRSPLLPAQK